jgi:tripartite-type tricarboxylate transporter receptor subunit TctC
MKLGARLSRAAHGLGPAEGRAALESRAPSRLSRRSLLAAAIALPFAARAEEWKPTQPIKVIVPYPPGGLTDVLGRLVGERLQSAFGQPAVIDNKPGAATQLGASMVAKAPPDGHTLLLATVSTLAITPALYAKPLIHYTDFAPVAMMGRVVLFLVCRPDLAVKDPTDLVALLRAKPDGYSYGSPGIGTAHHLLVELIRSRQSFSATHVPYLGSAKALVDLMEGRFDFMFLDAAVALQPIKAGKLKVLAVTGSTPDPTLPDVPPLTTYFPGLDLQPWMSIVGPAGLPAPVAAQLNGTLNKALAEPAFAQRLAEVGLAALPMTVEAFGEFIKRDAVRWAELVKSSGAKAE